MVAQLWRGERETATYASFAARQLLRVFLWLLSLSSLDALVHALWISVAQSGALMVLVNSQERWMVWLLLCPLLVRAVARRSFRGRAA